MQILIAGPDGSGKTTLADRLAQQLESEGVAVTRSHYRPRFSRSTKPAPAVTDPHGRGSRGVFASAAKLLLLFAEFWIADWSIHRRARRDGVLLVERGWWDQLVDPTRYRLPGALRPLVRILGRLLRAPDLVILASGDPAEIHRRKPEIGVAEVTRQLDDWKAIADAIASRVLVIDTVTNSVESSVLLAAHAFQPSTRLLRTPLSPSRLNIHATPNKAGAVALGLYRPLRTRAKLAMGISRLTLGKGMGRPAVEELAWIFPLLEGLGVSGPGISCMRSPGTPGRWVVGVSDSKRLRWVVKIGDSTDAGLAREAEMLTAMQASTAIGVPRMIWSGQRNDRLVVATEAVTGSVSSRLSDDTVLTAALSLITLDNPVTHGDFAPWNIIHTGQSLVLIDWESASFLRAPLHDLSHFVVRSGALLHRYTPEGAVGALCQPGGIGARYLTALGLPTSEGPALLRRYLRRTAADWSPPEVRFRASMLRALDCS